MSWLLRACDVRIAGPIYSMYSTNEGIITGGKDGYVRMWNLNLQVHRPLGH